jgi:hypothetical protein
VRRSLWRSLRLAPVLGAAALVAAPALFPSSLNAGSTVNLHCSIVDAANGTPLSARCRIVDSAGKNRYPPPSTSFYHSASGGYFYANGSISCAVPAGPTTLTLKRGIEYREVSLSLNMTADTSIVIGLERIVSMDMLGWFSGDAHTHINHAGGYYILDPEDALLMAGAEGLNIVNCLDNSYYFTGAPASCSTPERIVFMSEEMRSSSYGHYGLVGLKSLVLPVSSIWWPLAMDIADSAHAQQGALVIAAHPSPTTDFIQVEAWPGSGIARELPVDCISRRVDAIDVMSYSNFQSGGVDLDMWYRLLNCGFRIPASAGTDATANRLDSNPVGGFRVYVRTGDDGFRADSWFEGLAAGRTFVTNGPLITRFEVGGRASGDSCFYAHPGAVVSGRVSMESAYPIDRIEIVRNGGVELTLRLQPSRSSVDTSFSFSLQESSWIAARVIGAKRGWIVPGDSLFAHASPVYCTVADQPILVRDDAAYLAQWIEDLDLLVRAKGQWSNPSQSARVLGELAAARSWYEELAYGSVVEAGGALRNAPPALSCRNSPNPFSGATVIEFDVSVDPSRAGEASSTVSGQSEISADLAIYDVSGRLVRRLIGAQLVAGTFRIEWDGKDEQGQGAPSGIYFAKLTAAGRTFSRKMVVIR